MVIVPVATKETIINKVRCNSAPPGRLLELKSAEDAFNQNRRNSRSSKVTSQQHRQVLTKTSLQANNFPSLVKKRSRVSPSKKNSGGTICNNCNCSMAMSRTESILISSAGDVIVCRCRRSSTPFIPPKARDTSNVWDKQFPCCDTEILTSIDGPWSPVLGNLTIEKDGRTRTGVGSESLTSSTTETSTYEWEQNNNLNNSSNNNSIIGDSGLKGGSLGSRHIDQNLYNSVDTDSTAGQSVHVDQKFELGNSNHSQNNSKENRTIEHIGTESKEEDDWRSHSSNFYNNIADNVMLSLPSFDYSHIINGYNDMVPQAEKEDAKKEKKVKNTSSHDTNFRQKRRQRSWIIPPIILEAPTDQKDSEQRNDSSISSHENDQQRFYHGVPIFLSALSQVRITKVSANPLGAHVLMISEEALLFTYGLNHRGQLGIGFKSEIKNKQRGFHTMPTLITPLLENGGKAIHCAAGVDHSLVVVSTEGRRLEKLQSNPEVAHSDHFVESNDEEHVTENQSSFPETSVKHHQLYGFGRNNFMKLGLVRPYLNEQKSKEDCADDVVLPRRVALHCTVWPHEGSSADLSQGIFDIAASTEHSSALVRRATGDVEVYMWGNASLGALGLPLNFKSQEIRGEVARKPKYKRKKIISTPSIVEKLCHRPDKNPQSPFPKQISLGPYCSFVVMSNGKCMSCGFSAEGMLGHAFNTTFSSEPSGVSLCPLDNDHTSSDIIVAVSAGAFHTLVLTDDGKVYSCGINSNERLGLGNFDYSSLTPSIPQKKEKLIVTEWIPQRIDITSKKRITNNTGNQSNNIRTSSKVNSVCAGYDSSLIVTESGQVLSFGKRSGRLGQGEISTNVSTPQPLYGGLYLFHGRKKEHHTQVTSG